MYQGYSQLRMDGSSELFSLIWPRWGIVLDGQYTGLERSERPIDESASFSWRTPTGRAGHPSGTGYQPGSTIQIAHQVQTLWRTPQAHDAKTALPQAGYTMDLTHQINALWPTPVVPDGGRKPKGGSMSLTGKTSDGKKRQVDLAYAVRMWRTPQADENGSIVTPEARAGHHLHLSNQVQGQLNPEWVECLMGFPPCQAENSGLGNPLAS